MLKKYTVVKNGCEVSLYKWLGSEPGSEHVELFKDVFLTEEEAEGDAQEIFLSKRAAGDTVELLTLVTSKDNIGVLQHEQ